MRRFLFLSRLLVTGGIIAALAIDTDTRHAIQDHSGEFMIPWGTWSFQAELPPAGGFKSI